MDVEPPPSLSLSEDRHTHTHTHTRAHTHTYTHTHAHTRTHTLTHQRGMAGGDVITSHKSLSQRIGPPWVDFKALGLTHTERERERERERDCRSVSRYWLISSAGILVLHEHMCVCMFVCVLCKLILRPKCLLLMEVNPGLCD